MVQPIQDIHEFVENAPLRDIENHIRALQDELSKRNRDNRVDASNDRFTYKKSEFPGQFDR